MPTDLQRTFDTLTAKSLVFTKLFNYYEGNQPLDDAIMEHLRMKRISPEEAYDKCLDKKKFRPFLTTPPDDEE